MIQDFLFAESFWNLIPLNKFSNNEEQNCSNYTPPTSQQQQKSSLDKLASSQQMDLLQTYITLDDKGVTLQNQFGQITYT